MRRVCLRCQYTLPVSFQLSVGHPLDTTGIACICGVPSVPSLSIYIARVIPAERRTSLGHHCHRVCLRCAECAFVVNIHCPCHSSWAYDISWTPLASRVSAVCRVCLRCQYTLPMSFQLSVGHLLDTTVIACVCGVPSLSIYIAHVIPAERRTSLGHHWHRVCLRCAECAFVVNIHCPCHSSWA